MASKSKRVASSSQSAALAKARAVAKQKHPKGALTAPQLAADRANLVLARAALTKRTQTPAQKAAEKRNLAKARAVEHTKHGKGHQTAKQLAAERRNLAKARAHRHHHPRRYSSRLTRHAGSFPSGMRLQHIKGFHQLHVPLRPLGMHKIAATRLHHLTIHKPTGINPRFKARIAPTSYDQRGTWKRSHGHHIQHRLHSRKKKLDRVAKWRRRKHRYYPR